MDHLSSALTGNKERKQAAAQKKLKKFLEKGSLKDRFKALISYLDKATDDELKKFFNEHFYMIYGVFLDTFSAYENQCKRGRQEASLLKDLLLVLKNVMIYLSDYVKKGWQIRSIASVLEKILSIDNKHAFRKQAFELLMQFLELVRGREEAQVDLLGQAISLQPLVAKTNAPVNLLNQPLSDKSLVLLPGSGQPTIQESVELFELLLSSLDKDDPEIFLFWWDLLKSQYLIVFYPTIWPSKTQPKMIGFPQCPEEIQAPLIEKLEMVLKKPPIANVVWKSEENKQLFSEIMRQSLLLHVNLDDTIRKSISLYHFLYLESNLPEVSQEELLKYRTEFVRDTAAILTSKATWEAAEVTKRHEALCHEVVKMFKNMFLKIPDRIDESTREQIFYTLLSTASDLLAPQSPNPPLAEQLHGVLLDTILFLWICTKTRNTEHWERLCKMISGLFHNMHTVVQVSDKMMQMTMVVVENIYFVKTVKKKKTAKRPGMMGGDQSAKHLEPKSPDSESPPILPPKDELIWGIKWTREEALFVWRSMLQLFQNANTIRSPSIHVAVLKTLWMVISFIMWKEDHVPYQETLEPDRPEFLCMIDLFGPLLFSACDLPEAYVDGKAEAYKILCRMFCRHHIRPLPDFLLAHFYGVLQQGLVTRDSKNAVQNEILRNSSNLFNLGLTGANLLIPYYLQEIRRVLTGEGRSTDVKERAVIILCSLICFSSHFGETEIPAVSAGGGSGKGSGKDGNIHEFLRIAGAGSRGPAFQGAAGLSSPFPMTGLLNEVVSILTEALKMESVESLIAVRLIWGVAVAVFELVHSQPANVVLEINMLVLLMLKHLSGPSRVVVRAGIHAVTSLACMASQMREIDENVLNTIVESISGNIIKEMGDFRSNKCSVDEMLVSDQLYCLLEWVLALGDFVTNDIKVVGKVCEALESALMAVVKSDVAPRPKSRRKSMRPFTSMDESLTEMYALVVNVDSASVLLPQVREAAENVVLHLLHFLHNVPGREGIEVLSSLITHTDDLGGEGTSVGPQSSFASASSPLFSTSRDKGREERRGSNNTTNTPSASPAASFSAKDDVHVPSPSEDSGEKEENGQEENGAKEEGEKEEGSREKEKGEGNEGEVVGEKQGKESSSQEKGDDGEENKNEGGKEETKEGGKEGGKEGKEEVKEGKQRKGTGKARDRKGSGSSTKNRKGGSRVGGAVLGGAKGAKEGGRALHFVHNDNVVMSFVEVKHPDREGCFARVIIRDSIGKYTWDTDVVFDYEGMGATPSVPYPFADEHGKLLSADFVSPRMHADSQPPALRKKNPGLIPSYTNKYTEETDQLEQLLDYLTLKFPDCLVEEGETSLASPSSFPEVQQAQVAMTEEALVEQMKEDRCARVRMGEGVPPPQVWQMEIPATPVPKSPYHFCRMLLSHLGFLSENLGSVALILGDEEKIRRNLNQLDLTNGREMVKVGIIYLKEGQEEQLEVLRNDSSSRSPLFSEFVRSLGWPIDIPTHRAYLAGLDPKLTTGVTAPYFASSTFEMVFHDLTSMPTTDDPQQIHKKRHVGNDNVHVIWSEHLRDYNPRTIVSEFNDAHVVVYPLSNGLFKVHIYQKENVDLFGPLMHGMCVTKGLLAILIRQTSLMANKYVRYTHEGYVTPFTSRKRVLAQMVERHKAETTYRQYLGNIIA